MNEIEVNARIATLESQRNEQANRVVVMAGMLAMRDARIKELEAAQAPKDGPPVLKEVPRD